MKKITLTAFFRQADLSFDSSRWLPWKELVNWYREEIIPRPCFQELLFFDNPEIGPLRYSNGSFSYLKHKEVFRQLSGLMESLQQTQIPPDKVKKAFALIQDINFMLRDEDTDVFEMDFCRKNFVEFYVFHLLDRLPAADYHKVMRVEHFYQNPRCEAFSCENFI